MALNRAFMQEIASGCVPPFRVFTVQEVQDMVQHGVLRESEPIELIDGTIMFKDCRDPHQMAEAPTVHGPAHAAAVRRILRIFERWQPNPNWLASSQLPVQISPSQAPEPDTAILRGTLEIYDARHPAPADVVSLFEVSGTSVRFDRSTKQRIHATGGVPLYLIVNLENRHLERLDLPDPALGKYTRQTILKPGDVLRIELPGTGVVEIPVSEFFPADSAAGA